MTKEVRAKIKAIFIIFVIIFMLVIARLAYINIVKGDALRLVVKEQKLYSQDLNAERGSIYDRNGMPLAYSRVQYDVQIDLRDFSTKSFLISKNMDLEKNIYLEKVAEDLALLFELPVEEVVLEILKAKEAQSVSYKIALTTDTEKINYINQQGYEYGIWRDAKDFRSYPNSGLAADVVGQTRLSDTGKELIGVYGIERLFEEELKGVNGYYQTEKDLRNRELLYKEDDFRTEPINGYDVYLTIDGYIQNTVEQVLAKHFEIHKPKAIHAIVMNVKNGEVYAMGSYPTFNPATGEMLGVTDEYVESLSLQEQSDLKVSLWKNDIVESQYELGSTMKLITTAMALDSSIATPDRLFDEGNVIEVTGVPIHCWYYPHEHGIQTLTQAVAHSCNPVFVRLGLEMGADLFFDYYEAFGLNTVTGIDLPNEADGSSFDRETIRPVELATSTFGHGIAQTPLQQLTAIAAVINDGYLLEPHVVKSIETEFGETIYQAERTVIRQPISVITSQQMREIMEYTYQDYLSNGKDIAVDGVRLGVKTGTSEKIVNGEYSGDAAIASLVMVAPINDPEIAIYIIVDEPQDEIYGSIVAAPIAREIMEQIVDYLGFDRQYETDTVLSIVPDLVGLSLEEAQDLLETADLTYRITSKTSYTEESIIDKQFPAAGTERPLKSSVLLEIND